MIPSKPRPPWWEEATLYQIYPRSFQDSDGNGIGDLAGIASRLDYLEWLGVGAVWLSPIFPSPMADFGYDITDYCDIDPIFGSLEQFDALLAKMHRRGLKLVLDFVPNHTSDRHPWFEESRRSRSNPKRDWYIWRDPAPDGGPPNNWRSNFGGSAWEFDPATGQYYYHAFLRAQPDLNWRHPEVRAAMQDVLRFWLDRGVDGFRVDVIWMLVKDDEFRDNPVNPEHAPGRPEHERLMSTYTADRPEVHDIIAGLRGVIDEYEERLLVGEIYLPVERLIEYYGEAGRGAHLPFNFQLIHLPWRAVEVAGAIEHYESLLPDGAWPNWVLGNHDNPRIARRVGAGQARVAAMLLLTLRGTPTLYYGDELGMADVPIPPEAVRDPFEKNLPGLGLGRDPERTPMQWGSGPYAGFSTVPPWLPVSADAGRVSVASLREDPRSILTLYRRLLHLRRTERALAVGDYLPLRGQAHLRCYAGRNAIGYVRCWGERRLQVALNFGSEPHEFRLLGGAERGKVLLSTALDRGGEEIGLAFVLRGDEGLVIELD